MSNILLINPTVSKTEIFSRGAESTASLIAPLGIAYIAAYLRNAGHKVEMLDGVATPISLDALAKRVQSFDIIGFTVVTSYYLRVAESITKIRKLCNPCPKIIVGGAHATVRPEELLAVGADYAVLGEGEATTLELVNVIEAGASSDRINRIHGIAYMDDSGQLIKTQKRTLINNLDEIPMPARDLLPMHLYRGTPARANAFPSHSMLTSRGCDGSCTFCDHKSFGNKIRSFSPERIVDEFFLLRDSYGAKDISIWDDNFTLNDEHVMSVCSLLINRKFNRSFSVESRVDSVNLDKLTILKQAGCEFIAYGFESGSQRVLDSVSKKETLEQMRRAVSLTKKCGIKIRGYFMLGFPGETVDEMKATVAFAKELDVEIATFTLLVPFPGTVDYFRAKKSGIFDPDFYKKQIIPEFNFLDSPIYTPESMSPKDLLKFHKKAYNSYYFRPRAIIKHIANLRSKDDIIAMLRGGYTLIRNAFSS